MRSANLLTIRIQPDEDCAAVWPKVPNTRYVMCPVNMDFNYAAAFGTSTANGMRLCWMRCLGPDAVCASRWRRVTWRFITRYWSMGGKESEVFPNYFADRGSGLLGALLERGGHAWGIIWGEE